MEPIVKQAVDKLTAELDNMMPIAKTILERAVANGDIEPIANLYSEAFGFEDGVYDALIDLIPNEYDDSMDGDFDTAMASAGFGTDEDYGSFGEDN